MTYEEFGATLTYYPESGHVYKGATASVIGEPIMSEPITRLHAAKTQWGYVDPLNYKTSKVEQSILKASVIANQFGSRHFEPSMMTAADVTANAQNLSHLQLIRLLPYIQGLPEPYFFLEQAFVERPIPQLQFRESFTSYEDQVQYLDRMEEAKSAVTKFAELEYNLKKLVGKVYTPIEDLMRTIISPQSVALSNYVQNFLYKRNRLALAAIQKITRNATGGTTANALGNLSTIGSGELHSDNRFATKLHKTMNDFMDTNDMPITHVIMNTNDYAYYTENTWTRKGPIQISPDRQPRGGVFPLAGFTGVDAILDIAIPSGQMWCINKPNALRKGQGPQITRKYYDEDRDSEVIKILDFVQFLAVDAEINADLIGGRRFSYKCTFTVPS